MELHLENSIPPINPKHQETKGVSLSFCCRLFGISRQSVYQSKSRSVFREAQLKIVKTLVLQVRREMPRIGTRKLYYILENEFKIYGIK